MKIRVLLADDHVVFLEGLGRILEDQDDIEVVGRATNGQLVIDKALELQPDIVLMDISMPKLNGIEAAGRLAKTAPNIKIVFLSFYDTSEHVQRALRTGAKGFILKEVGGSEVLNAIRQVNAGRRYFSEKIVDLMVDNFVISGFSINQDQFPTLSRREVEVLKRVLESQTSFEIAAALGIAAKTVETYRSRICQKLGVSSTVELVKFAIRHGLPSQS
jgi:DNA-binding NarL/FixJ family response regulator